MRRQLKPGRHLISSRDAHIPHGAVGILDDPTSFVQGCGAVDFREVVFGEPFRTIAPALFIRLGQKNDIAVKGNLLLRESNQSLGKHSQRALVVDGSAAVKVAILQLPAKGVQMPARSLDSDHSGLRSQQNRLFGSVPLQPRKEVNLPRIRCWNRFDLKTEWRQCCGQKLGDFCVFPRRVGAINANQLCQQLRCWVRGSRLAATSGGNGEKRYQGNENPFRLADHSVAPLEWTLPTHWRRVSIRYNRAWPRNVLAFYKHLGVNDIPFASHGPLLECYPPGSRLGNINR